MRKSKIGDFGITSAVAIASAVFPFITSLLNQGQAEIAVINEQREKMLKPIVDAVFLKYPTLKNVRYGNSTFGELYTAIQGSIDSAKGKGKNEYEANLDCLFRNIILTILPCEPVLGEIVNQFAPRKNWTCTQKAESFTSCFPITQTGNQNQNFSSNQNQNVSFQPNMVFYLILAVIAYFLFVKKQNITEILNS
jgi:hypothetical protein